MRVRTLSPMCSFSLRSHHQEPQAERGPGYATKEPVCPAHQEG